MTTRWRSIAALAALTVFLAAACAGAAPSTAGPSPAGGPVTTEAQAIARIIAFEPRLAGIQPRDPNGIGQASWFEIAPASGVGVFLVSVRVGWGDCPAGCINEHTWVYAIGPNGEVTVQSQGGDPVPASEWPTPGVGSNIGTGIVITAAAGPTCPVEQPGDPACAPRLVADALIVVTDGAGNEIAQGRTDANGMLTLELSPGAYAVAGQPVEGLMGTPEPMQVVVADGTVTPVALGYDTGIR